ncbi:hypothetical protein D8674_026612 [Pyrus ussuriensis x Pyrus communis]|uniref:Uncharacterized protein n=1 Tax=Pyrus ussuriensis x Pyrus communis TaxID=2448454 RepID=A0A5N5I8D7_9ROSA|nr:hypothetical protein D8674_026612 [Pyrus ussuriensis x Pyrus communis]
MHVHGKAEMGMHGLDGSFVDDCVGDECGVAGMQGGRYGYGYDKCMVWQRVIRVRNYEGLSRESMKNNGVA